MSEYWKETELNLGEVQEGGRVKAIFKANDNVPEIIKMSSSCGCTTPVYNSSTKELHVMYSAKKVSKHLKNTTGVMIVTQTVTLVYENGEKEILSLKIKVTI